MREPEGRRYAASEITPEELALIAKVARAFRTTERDELQAELAGRLLDLKAKRPAGIRDWNAYLTKFLYNKANTWIDKERRRESRFRALEQPASPDEDVPSREPREMRETDPSAALALAQAWAELPPELRRFWEVLLEENGNQVKAAERLRVHRNTARKWRGRILHLLRAHGIRAPD